VAASAGAQSRAAAQTTKEATVATRYERLVEVVEPDTNGVEVTLALPRRFSQDSRRG